MKTVRNTSGYLIANITWNRFGWSNLYVDPRAGHRYARKHPGHESLNFDFSKKGIDTADEVYGHIAWTRPPAKFGVPGFIFFYSRNLDTGTGEIVGVYGDARIVQRKKVPYKGFQNGVLELNVAAQKSSSMLFPVPLRASRYSSGRVVPQCGFTYIGETSADEILRDEILALRTSGGARLPELQKLKNIYSLATGKSYRDDSQDDDLKQQEEIVGHLKKQKVSTQSLIDELRCLQPTDPQAVTIKAKTYKRDNKTIAQLKILRGFKCQLCRTQIRKRNGGYYVEAAHITPKSRKGLEMPDNILILCPNHHKEFDLGERKITSRQQERLEFYLNGRFCRVDLRLRAQLN